METIDIEVAVASWLKRRRLKPGNCLNHAKVLLAMPSDLAVVCVLCMGPTRGNILHCWLEAGEVVADLTRPIRFVSRNGYYEMLAVKAEEVQRYSAKEIGERVVKGERLTFWGFDLQAYKAN